MPKDAGKTSLQGLQNGALEFLKAWGLEYPRAFSNNSKFLWLCGLRYQLAILMAVMIGLVYLSANYAVQSTVLYTKDQKLSDLTEECNATTNKVALLLQQGYAEALTTFSQPGTTATQTAYPSQFFDSVSAVPLGKETNQRSEQAWQGYHFDAPAFPEHSRWSHFYWEQSRTDRVGEAGDTTKASSTTSPRAFINLYLKVPNGEQGSSSAR